MLGAEGVKTLVIDRLEEAMPAALAAVAARFNAAPGEIPAPKDYYPSKVPAADIPTGGYPFVTVNVTDTDGELSNDEYDVHESVRTFSIGYNVLVVVYTQVSGQNGEPLARLQAERIALAIREAVLWDRWLYAEGDENAQVPFARWSENYDTTENTTAGAWLGWASLVVPVSTMETLDTAPYADPQVVLESFEVYGRDPITGVPYPETIEDTVDGHAPTTPTEG